MENKHKKNRNEDSNFQKKYTVKKQGRSKQHERYLEEQENNILTKQWSKYGDTLKDTWQESYDRTNK